MNVNDLIEEWFDTHLITTLNIYVLALILIEQSQEKKLIIDVIDYILNNLINKHKLQEHHKEIVYLEIEEEQETLSAFQKLLFEISDNPNLLQKDKFAEKKKEPLKMLFCKPESMNEFRFGHIKNK